MIDFEAIDRKREEQCRKQKAADTLRERATDTSAKITGMRNSGSAGNKQEQVRINMIAAQEAADKAGGELDAMIRQLLPRIGMLKKWQHAEAIRKRYVEGKAISQIAEEIGYEWSQTNRFLKEAKEIINRQNGIA